MNLCGSHGVLVDTVFYTPSIGEMLLLFHMSILLFTNIPFSQTSRPLLLMADFYTYKPSMISFSSGHFKLPNIRLLHCHMCHYSFEVKFTFKSACTFAKITLQLRFQKPRLHNSVPVHCTDPAPILRKSHLHWQGHFQALMRNKTL